MAHKVKCIYCQQVFDRDKYPYIQVSSRRYAHPACAQAENKKKQEEENDKELEDDTGRRRRLLSMEMDIKRLEQHEIECN